MWQLCKTVPPVLGVSFRALTAGLLAEVASFLTQKPRRGGHIALPHTPKLVSLVGKAVGGLVYARPGHYRVGKETSIVEYDVTKCLASMMLDYTCRGAPLPKARTGPCLLTLSVPRGPARLGLTHSWEDAQRARPPADNEAQFERRACAFSHQQGI